MNQLIKALKNEMNYTTTENGATALHSTQNACLDAFGSLGAMKNSPEEDIIRTFSLAFNENREYAMRMLFYMRDIRGGQGMRRVFRVIIKWLAEAAPDYIVHNLSNILYYGRGDDILYLLDTSIQTDVVNWAFAQLKTDYKNFKNGLGVSLLAKWMPSENTSSKETRRYATIFRKGFGWKSKYYRQFLSKMRKAINVTEVKMSARDWTNIEYEAVPAKASLKYADAFMRHDENGYMGYLKDVATGNAKVNAASLFPVDIVHKCLNESNPKLKDRLLWDAMWNALPNYCTDTEETGICVVDTSGSMHGTPIEVAISLGMYCADKCHGPFKNHFITFSECPQLVEISGHDIVEKAKNICRANWNMNTNFEAVFDLILNTARKYHTPADQMPKKLYVISDMQFDEARSEYYWNYRNHKQPFMQLMRQKYEAAGYEMPTIVYWNVRASKCGMFQDTFEGENCCMVSGYSPSLFKSIVEGTIYEEIITVNSKGEVKVSTKATVNPIDVMLAAIMNERYDQVFVG